MKTLNRLGRKPKDTRVAIQGFGNVGSHAAKFLSETDCKVIAISDVSGGYLREDGINAMDAIRYARENNGLLRGYGEADTITNEALLEMRCRNACACSALGGVITGENATRVKAPVIIEAANAPIRPDADAIFDENGITVLPDILANAGGVTVSYFRWRNIVNFTIGI